MSGDPDPPMGQVIPPALLDGVPMLKMTSRKIKQVIVKIEKGRICWGSRKGTELPISSIRELRLNHSPTSGYPSSRWITIIYVRSNQYKILHMTALTDETYSLWVKTLTTLVSETSDRSISQITPTSDPDTLWIKQLWPAGVKSIDLATAQGLCGGLGLSMPLDNDEQYVGRNLDFNAFRDLVKRSQVRPEFSSIFHQIAGTDNVSLNKNQVEQFLTDVQKVSPMNIFDKYKDGAVWDGDCLTNFLLSTDNTQSPEIDMSYPLTQYFISSSHNTYLMGEQWRGESTAEGYIRVLLAKCRCVEMDCHDGDSEPQVYHQKTLTSKVPVREICESINKYAFVASPYPVIISAEVHCSLEQQEMLGKILRETFGDKLVTEPLEGDEKGFVELPSPEQLKYRILFKTKPPSSSSGPPTPVGSELIRTESLTSSNTESDSGLAKLARRLSIASSNRTEKAPPTFSSSLSDLLVYTQGVKYQGFSKLVTYQNKHQFSVSDRTAGKIIKDNTADWIKHNFTHISRVYPRAARLTSGNYDPVPFWAAGCQLVALNWQTPDDGTLLNHAMFTDTQGYVLKPPALRKKLVEPIERFRVRVRIISAQRLPPSSDVYVESTLSSGSEETNDLVTRSKRTEAVTGPTLHPMWNEAFNYDITTTRSQLDLSFLHLKIYARSTKNQISTPMLAQWIKPVSRVPRGYHHLALYDGLYSRFVFATLFVRIDVDTLS